MCSFLSQSSRTTGSNNLLPCNRSAAHKLLSRKSKPNPSQSTTERDQNMCFPLSTSRLASAASSSRCGSRGGAELAAARSGRRRAP
uniref:Uncharacterized protein n=2 Tax=Arundo donax TaxID=35708 RepID=A0A0A8Z3G0_ARUDO